MTVVENVPGTVRVRAGQFATAIVKLTAVCNLNCTYCYMFNLADRTFERTTRFMAPGVAEDLVEEIGRYCERHGRGHFTLALHGGEPSMWPIGHHARLLTAVETWRRRGLDLKVLVQTNGLHLPDPLLELWRTHSVGVGISLDGPAEINDAHRVRHDGKGSYAIVMNTVARMLDHGYGDILNGFLCVAQPDMEPAHFLDWAERLPGPGGFDVLWPIQYNYANPPWGEAALEDYAAHPRYGIWFSELFLLWAAGGQRVRIRQFEQAVSAFVGGCSPSVDSLANEHLPALVVNTLGQIELNDYVRAFEDGAAHTGLMVGDGLDAAESLDAFQYYLNLGDYRPTECNECPVVAVCGGGFLPGRMSPGHTRPVGRSVLCYDQFAYFRTVQSVVNEARDLAWSPGSLR